MMRSATRRRLPRWWPAPILVALAAAAGVTRWLVTLSHTERTAEAVVGAEAAPSG